MAIQLYKATLNPSNEVYLHSYPSTGLPASQSAYTFMVWINTNVWATGATSVASIVGMYNGTNDAATVPTTGLQIGSDANNVITCWTFGGTGLVSTTGYTPPANTWIHAAYSCTAISGGNQTHSIYINGILNNTATNALQTAGTYTQVYINGFPQTTTAANTYTETSLTQQDDVEVFNRQLSASEILSIYNTFGMRDGIVYGLVARYNFNELSVGSITTGVRDYSGLGNNLLVVNRGSGTVPTYIPDYSALDTRPVN